MIAGQGMALAANRRPDWRQRTVTVVVEACGAT